MARSSHPGQTVTAIEHLAHPSGLTVAFSGDSFESGSAPKGDVIGVVAALVVLLVVFGSVLAAGLPIVIALAGIGVAIPLIGIAAHAVPTPNFTDQVAALIGIGVGIDYTLLVVTRYRAALGRHGAPEQAVAEALSTAGRSVILAGSTVVVSLMGLFLMDVSTFDGLAVGSRAGGADRGGGHPHPAPGPARIRGRPDVQAVQSGGPDASLPGAGSGSPGAAACPALVGRRPVGLASLGMVGLLVLAAPALHLHLGTADAGTDPPGSTTRQAYDLAVRGFGPGSVAPITVVAQTPLRRNPSGRHCRRPGRAGAGLLPRGHARRHFGGCPAVQPVRHGGSRAGDPGVGPGRSAHGRAHRTICDTTPCPPWTTRPGLPPTWAGRRPATSISRRVTAERLPLLLLGVLTISFLLLLVGFRSVAIAAQAIVLNLLSVGAAYGIVVAVFQWGWGAGLTGAPAAPVAPWIPTLLFAITFGLSMDYEVFVIGAIRDARARHGNDRQAVDRRSRLHGRRHHCRRAHHGAGVRQLRDLQQPGSQGHRSGAGGGHRGGRLSHPAPDRPGHHDHPGVGCLVVPGLAEPLAARERPPVG